MLHGEGGIPGKKLTQVLCPVVKLQIFCKRGQKKLLALSISGLLEEVGYSLMVNLDYSLPTSHSQFSRQ